MYVVDRDREHLSPARLRDFAFGKSKLEAYELRHFWDCDECCEAWWKLKREAKCKADADDDNEKSA